MTEKLKFKIVFNKLFQQIFPFSPRYTLYKHTPQSNNCTIFIAMKERFPHITIESINSYPKALDVFLSFFCWSGKWNWIIKKISQKTFFFIICNLMLSMLSMDLQLFRRFNLISFCSSFFSFLSSINKFNFLAVFFINLKKNILLD